MIETNEMLLDRLKADTAHEAWEEFYRNYWQPILRYARKLGLSGHQSHEVLQDTMVALVRILPQFAYDRRRGKFRNFLLTIVHRKSLAVQRRARRDRTLSLDSTQPWGEGAMALLDVLAAPLPDAEAAEAERRWRESLLETALANLRADPTVEPRTLAVFEAYVIVRRSVDDVAAEFGLKENAIYQIKNRLLRRVRAEAARMAREARA
jgi:RNA polymerase sigma-70 factor (ECF subfamily)